MKTAVVKMLSFENILIVPPIKFNVNMPQDKFYCSTPQQKRQTVFWISSRR